MRLLLTLGCDLLRGFGLVSDSLWPTFDLCISSVVIGRVGSMAEALVEVTLRLLLELDLTRSVSLMRKPEVGVTGRALSSP